MAAVMRRCFVNFLRHFVFFMLDSADSDAFQS
jgi:hypothetical protein